MENFIDKIKNLVSDALIKTFEIDELPKFNVEKTKNISHGNYSSNVALVLSKKLKMNPMIIGENLIKNIDKNYFEKIETAKPGFINFFFSKKIYREIILDVSKNKSDYGQHEKRNEAINIEYVSANPTGNLHLGHARNAAFGSTLSNVFQKYGYDVDCEYYVNDAGNQINILGVSVLIQYLRLHGIDAELDKTFYNGIEPKIVAQYLKENYGDQFVNTKYEGANIFDEQIRNTINTFSKYFLLEAIKITLEKFNAKFDIFYMESEVYRNNLVPPNLKKMVDDLYMLDGALWLETTKNDDDKDRVLVKSDGNMTYFAPDTVYHSIKLSRKNYVKIIDILGADHGDYKKRMQAAIYSLGYQSNLVVVTLQMIKLTKDGEAFKMSKRTGIGITMNDLIETIGVGASRWFMLSQDANSHLEIDIDKCMKKDNSNHYYYVQYAYIRIQKILAAEKYENYLKTSVDLENEKELEILDHVSFFPILVKNVAEMYELQKITTYLYDLANLFHSYYANVKIVENDNIELKNARLNFLNAIKWVLVSGLNILGIEPLEKI